MSTTTTESVTYVRPDGTPYSDKDLAVIERVRAELLGNAWHGGYQGDFGPPINNRDYAAFLEAVTRMAREGRGMAQAATHIVRSVNLYGTRGQMANAVRRAVADLIREGTWDDVIARTGPEPLRHSAAQKPWTLGDRVYFQYFIAQATATVADHVPGVGWCVDAIRRAECPRAIRPHDFPALRIGE